MSDVRKALLAIRYDHSLADNPLLDLAAVTGVLLREGVAATPRGRAWALALLIDELVTAHLGEARRGAGVATRSGLTDLTQLDADFEADSHALEVWSALYHRYLDPARRQAGALAARLGMPRRTFGRRLAAGEQFLAEALVDAERETTSELAERPGAPLLDRILVPVASTPSSADAAAALVSAIRDDRGLSVSLTEDSLEQLASSRPRDLATYRLSRVAAWCRPSFRLDERFCDLTLMVDRGENDPDRWQQTADVFTDLAQVLHHVKSTAVVILGAPGSGKTTLLRRLELDLAAAGLRGETDAIPFLAHLGSYRGTASPAEWLAGIWSSRYPELPPLDDSLQQGGVVLLLDGLNELPHSDLASYRSLILDWKRYLHDSLAQRPGARAVFTCRSLDYGAPLSSPDYRVPQVRIERMSDEQIKQFLHRHSPARAEVLWRQIVETGQLNLVRSPYLLTLLVEQADERDSTAVGRAALFTGFVRSAISREIERDNPLFAPGELIDERDYRRAMSTRRWATPWELPQRGPLIPGLARLATGMQASTSAGGTSQVAVEYDRALELIDHPSAERIVEGGEALGVLDESRARDELMFFHQLLQEYFAARHLAEDALQSAALVRVESAAELVQPDLATVISGLETAEPLPPLPTTGWEETVLLAASMSDAPSEYLDRIAGANLALAGRAAAQPDLAGRVAAEHIDRLVARLLDTSRDLSVDLRARIDAALALAHLGDPRLTPREGAAGRYVDPVMIDVPAGEYRIGWDGDEYPEATPQHQVRVEVFALGRFPVTNAEWSCFIESGGYDDERWWVGDDALAWQRGELTAQGSRQWVRDWLQKMRDDPALLDSYRSHGLSPEQEAMWRARLAMTEAELEAHLLVKYANRRYRQPYTWRQERHNAPSQPVNGISWYEARAYCAWLSYQTGERFRLPTEVEWEAAARGGDGRLFPWGDTFDQYACNSGELHLRRAAPIGVLPSGASPFGVEMLSGDIQEWTSTLWGSDPDHCAFRFPYQATDGREDEFAPAAIRRVKRSGGFVEGRDLATTVARDGQLPDTRFTSSGMRLAKDAHR